LAITSAERLAGAAQADLGARRAGALGDGERQRLGDAGAGIERDQHLRLFGCGLGHGSDPRKRPSAPGARRLRPIWPFPGAAGTAITGTALLLHGERAAVDGELDDLRAFVAVVETGGFGRAAARLGLAKSIVSRRVSRLEASLGGARLLARTTRGVSPTEAGRRLPRPLRPRAGGAGRGAGRGGGPRDGVAGTLRIAAPLSFGIAHLAPALARFAAEHPRVALDVAYGDRPVDLVGERFDAAVRIGTLADSSLVARRIAPVRLALVASPAYLAAAARPSGRTTWRARLPRLLGRAQRRRDMALPRRGRGTFPCARTAASAPTTAKR
jgi:DNA-binding transcriptional LysR family regulator